MAQTPTSAELLIRQRLNALERTLPGAQKGDVESIHQARVATRRLREALPLIVSGARARKLGRAVRKLTRALGPVRELDVVLLTLDELEAAGGVPAAAIAKLRQVIRRERLQLQTEMRGRVAGIDVPRLRRRAAAATRRRRPKRGGRDVADPKRLLRAGQRAARRAGRLRAAVESAAGIYLPDRLHQVRIAVKKLRYALELTRALRSSRARPHTRGRSKRAGGSPALLRTLRDTQDLLGRMNDLEVLIARVRGVQGSSALDLRRSADLDKLVRRLETECRQLHGHYMASRRKLLAICDRASDAAAERGRAAPAA